MKNIERRNKHLSKIDSEYIELVNLLKQKIQSARRKAVLSVNRELITLYWEIGRSILEKQKKEGWGAKIIDKLSRDLSTNFPDMKGFSTRNLKYMRKFAESYPDIQIVQGVLAQLTWYHNIALLDKIYSLGERLWYARQTMENGWSRNILVIQIESDLYKRQALVPKTTNYERTLPAPQSDLAVQMLKDPYNFDFLSIGQEAQERAIEKALVNHIMKFLLELGAGFAFVGSQYRLEVGEEDYYLDLLFYHLKLQCYVAIELKTGEFKPEDAGKINFYLSALDDLVKDTKDNPSIGMILCKTKNRLTVEYALRDLSKPIGVAEYNLVRAIPKKLKAGLPTVEELEAEFGEFEETERVREPEVSK